ncbi:MAG: phosphoribosylglycinamide formyltransferase [Parvularculaceae bacterium]|nr:phosphoribosylglycinamide formyltransferase [Parvularculaceae bacterium]
MTAATDRKRVAVLISGRGSNMASLIAAAAAPDFPATIALVLSNRPDADGLVRAREYGVATAVVDHRAYGKGQPGRAAFDDALDEALHAARIDIVCLAGFMRLLTAPLVERWRGRMLNIHPSLLPAFKGLDVHARMLEAGVRIAGCTVHFVSAEMDEGPIIGQAAVPVLDGDDADSLAARILAAEHRLYPACLRLVASGAARLDGGQVRCASAAVVDGVLVNPPA